MMRAYSKISLMNETNYIELVRPIKWKIASEQNYARTYRTAQYHDVTIPIVNGRIN